MAFGLINWKGVLLGTRGWYYNQHWKKEMGEKESWEVFMVEQRLFGQKTKSQHLGTEGTEQTSLFIDKTAEVHKETRALLSINEKISELYDRAMDLFSLILRQRGISWHYYCSLRGYSIVDKPKNCYLPVLLKMLLIRESSIISDWVKSFLLRQLLEPIWLCFANKDGEMETHDVASPGSSLTKPAGWQACGYGNQTYWRKDGLSK